MVFKRTINLSKFWLYNHYCDTKIESYHITWHLCLLQSPENFTCLYTFLLITIRVVLYKIWKKLTRMPLTVMTTSTGKKFKFQSISTISKLPFKRIQNLIKTRTSLLSYTQWTRKFLLILARKKGIPHAERLLRIDCHKIHTVALIVNARIRNKWINDPLLHVGNLSTNKSEGAVM